MDVTINLLVFLYGFLTGIVITVALAITFFYSMGRKQIKMTQDEQPTSNITTD